jgi:hypothetical protein
MMTFLEINRNFLLDCKIQLLEADIFNISMWYYSGWNCDYAVNVQINKHWQV